MNKNKRNKMILLGGIGVGLVALLSVVHGIASWQGNNLDLLFPGKATVTDDGSGLSADYIDYEFDTAEEALQNARDMTQKTSEEGMTLLKNESNALPLSSSAKVTILGYYSWHNNMAGGEDPATTEGAISLGQGIENAFDTNEAVNNVYDSAAGELSNPEESLGTEAIKATFAEYDTAIITIKRNSGEGNDQSMDSGSSEQHRTGLTLNNAELDLVDFACDNFSKVILVINAANTMELDFLKEGSLDANGYYTDPYNSKSYNFSKVQGAIWAGCCGSQGGTALANILNGSVNPSGHLVDTYIADLTKDPTYQNFGSYLYENSSDLNSYQEQTFFVEYEEGIYIGYRYYETAAYEAREGNYSGFDYDAEVTFPFGYGLSYTDFSLEYEGTPSYDAENGTYNFKVKVTNTGSVAGKGLAQIYVNAPYVKGGVEKAHVVLGGFKKTEILQPNASETVDISVQEDYFASYDYRDEECYVLDAGTYKFYLSENAHSWATIDEENDTEKAKHLWSYEIEEKVVFKDSEDGKRKTDLSEAVNKEDDEVNYKFKEYDEGSTGDGFAHNMTRENFKDSFPTAPIGNDFILSDERALEQVGIYDVWDEKNNDITEMPEINTDETDYNLVEMRGVDYDDPKWDDYMNQFTLDSMVQMFSNGGWNELADEENGVPLSYDADSPYGFYAAALSIKTINKWYCGAPMVAATWNPEFAKELGKAFGEESHGNYLAGGTLITGLYGYGANTHRSAFGGRNYEYYSEDPLLAGKMAAAEASGASEKGLITFMKHYVLNEQETNRQKNGYCAWANEQAMREIYIKPWEIYIKEAKMQINYYDVNEAGEYEMVSKTMPAATGIMTAYNRVGATYAGASLSINGILRDECGYTGTTVTDAGGQPHTYMTTDFMIRRGGSLTLANNGNDGLYDTESPTAVYWIKDAAKHILYNKANSNCVVGLTPGASISYGLAPWRLGLYIAWGVVGALVIADAVVITLISLDKIKVKEKVKKEEDTSGSEF